MANSDLRSLLKDELKRRQDTNPSYSLRAFARGLEISPAQLSQVFSGKRSITPKLIQKLSGKLGFSPTEKKQYLTEAAGVTDTEFSSQKSYYQMRQDEFSVIADWEHFAILSLTKIRGAKKDPVWIAKRIGVTAQRASDALSRLERLGILEKGEKFKQLCDPIRVISDVGSDAIKKFHRQTLGLAESRLMTVPVDQRDYSAMTFAGNSRRIKRAAAAIEQFQNELTEILSGGEPDSVFTFACQLFPVTEEIQK